MDIFERLARKLDELPQGFPHTESGVELRILRHIFDEEDAAMALKLTPRFETAEDIARRLEQPVAETRTRLDEMAIKGQIGSFKMGGHQMYRLMPFVIGIYEQQRQSRLTHELVHLFEEYLPMLSQVAGGHPPHVARVIPAHGAISPELVLLPHEDIRQIIDRAKSFRVQDCICRREQALLGKQCHHATKTCLQFSMEADAYAYFKLDGDIITREDALKIAIEAENEGLVHTTHNVKDLPAGFLCNCCSCCCGLIRSLKEYHSPFVLAKSNYVAHIDPDSCQACGVCRDERCPMDAIEEGEGVYQVIDNRCIGCGVCVITCPGEAIALVARSEADRDLIAQDMQDWGQKKLER
ncbi:4Fe-4S binding protein [Desulfobacca acetoxidans]|uniref:4Fe-4S ferredoxin iron-sulfur binding domain-containing protein n=1 Tax=Desulfobacca acetoxidans (strain ATCC 700848 / DSM 11109 / ASRB2) TaxID=880072 RepID=F2NF87_DESAR|nr:4Fe-4S binding protein [Desulfobacca acetoxidans]AEB08642.1 4Fe-4S ferredoxin iron-sulfur binding domain-containing protein [Desulfobacca acetoxidans DSM 11109]